MASKILVMVLVIVLVVGGIYYIATNKGENNDAERIPDKDFVDGSHDIDEEGKSQNSDYEIEKGKEAIDFTLEDLDGNLVSLSDYRGEIVLINFWATWCGFCDAEMPDLEKLDRENEDLVVLAVNVKEKQATVKKYIDNGGYDFKVVLDKDGQVSKTYLVNGLPTSYFVDTEGVFLGGIQGMMTYEQMEKIIEGIRGEG